VSLDNELAYSARDSYTVSPGHTLIIPRRHVASFFDLTPEEMKACMELISEERRGLDEEFKPDGDGYNIGVNVGPAAGQGIFHAHIHVIPRYQGDVENPQEGGRAPCDSRQGTLHALKSIISSV
jgi:diadenosine tetraphosphate (Ap4A) HIT family hydrolase